MKSIYNEIFKFLSDISQRELRRNYKLREEIKTLIGRLERPKIKQEKPKEMVDYLSKEMLETK